MLPYLVGIPFIMHGLAMLSGFFEAVRPITRGFTHEPWIFSRDVTLQQGKGRLLGLLWLLSTLVLLATGAAVLAGAEWWRWMGVASAAFAFLTALPWWNTAPIGARVGMAFDLIVIAILLSPLGAGLVSRLQ